MSTTDAMAAHLARGGEIVLFDGVCNLCNGWVLFVIDRDPTGHFRFAPLQSPEAARLLAERGRRGESLASVLLVDADGVHERSTAALRVTRRLGGGWPLVSALLVLPAGVRNLVYDWIARNRYRWFGRQDACRLPTPELQDRFLA